MKMVRGVVILSAFALSGAVRAVPQQVVPPPPRPAGSGPSLEATMQFIQQKLSSIGRMSYVAPWHNITNGADGANTMIWELSNVSANAGNCTVLFHVKVTRDGTVVTDINAGVPLKEAKDVIVEPIEAGINKANAEAGAPNMVVGATTPAMVELVVRRQTTGANVFNFVDADAADRTAKAFTHAIELCGGGNKDIF